jgi:hypothetical protein
VTSGEMWNWLVWGMPLGSRSRVKRIGRSNQTRIDMSRAARTEGERSFCGRADVRLHRPTRLGALASLGVGKIPTFERAERERPKRKERQWWLVKSVLRVAINTNIH